MLRGQIARHGDRRDSALAEPALTSRSGRRIIAKRKVEEVEAHPAFVGLDRGASEESDRLFAAGSALVDCEAVRRPKIRHETDDPAFSVESLQHQDGRRVSARSKRRSDKLESGGRAGGIFKSAAIQVLRNAGRLMSTGDITKAAVRLGYINVQGKTPDATMASALYTDIKRKEGLSVFIKPHEGLFGLREWLDKGYTFTDPEQVVRVDSEPESVPSAQRRRRDLTPPPHLSWREARERQAPMIQGGSRRQPRLLSRAGAAQQERQYSSNLEVLFAAVDELSSKDGSPPAATTSEDSIEESRAPDYERATSAFQPLVPAAQPSGELHASPMDLRAYGSEACQLPSECGLMPGCYPHQMSMPLLALKRLMTAAQAEIFVRSLEADVSVPPSLLMQAHMQLCKLYGEAGMLEQACSSLSKAMEIGDTTGQCSPSV